MNRRIIVRPMPTRRDVLAATILRDLVEVASLVAFALAVCAIAIAAGA